MHCCDSDADGGNDYCREDLVPYQENLDAVGKVHFLRNRHLASSLVHRTKELTEWKLWL